MLRETGTALFNCMACFTAGASSNKSYVGSEHANLQLGATDQAATFVNASAIKFLQFVGERTNGQ
jgi:hypothetical protein